MRLRLSFTIRLLGYLCCLFTLGPIVRADVAAVSAAPIADVTVGFHGLHKVGYWTPVRVTLVAGEGKDLSGKLSLITSDGDGTLVRFEGPTSQITVPVGEKTTVTGKVKFGRIRAGLSVEFVDADGKRTVREFGPDEFAERQLSDSSITLTLGTDIGIQRLIDKQAGTEVRAFARRLDDPEDLPTDWLAYEAIDMIVVPTRDNELLNSLNDERLDAIRRWVAMGGRMLIGVGARGEEVFSPDSDSSLRRLAGLIPGEFVALTALTNSAALEQFSGAVQQLVTNESPLDVELTVVRDLRGTVELSNAGARGIQPLVIRGPFGFGEVVFTAFDLDHPLIADWVGREPLIVRLLRVSSAATDQVGPGKFGGRMAHVGFTDLAGQLRGALDQFSSVPFVPFYWVAGLVFIYVLLIGPGDYFLLKKAWGQMQWTWITFPTLVVAFSVAAVYLFTSLKEGTLRINQVDLIDVDLESKHVRGSTWADIYSPQTEQYGLRWQASPELAGVVDDVRNSASWQGLPGTGLGGFNTTATAPAFTPPYQIVSTNEGSRMLATPIQVSATKSFQVRWWGETELESAGRLTMDRDHLLVGEISNPLPIDLEKCTVFFGDWMYRLESRLGELAAGESIRIETERPLNLEWKLTRRRVEDSRDVTTPWNQNSIDVPRIIEMMMFHESAGGESYTQLSHRYHSFVDLSHLLQRGRAILLGRAKQRPTDLQIDGASAETYYDQTWTYYRVVFPVQNQSAE